jgi:hypothetical protein
MNATIFWWVELVIARIAIVFAQPDVMNIVIQTAGGQWSGIRRAEPWN